MVCCSRFGRLVALTLASAAAVNGCAIIHTPRMNCSAMRQVRHAANMRWRRRRSGMCSGCSASSGSASAAAAAGMATGPPPIRSFGIGSREGELVVALLRLRWRMTVRVENETARRDENERAIVRAIMQQYVETTAHARCIERAVSWHMRFCPPPQRTLRVQRIIIAALCNHRLTASVCSFDAAAAAAAPAGATSKSHRLLTSRSERISRHARASTSAKRSTHRQGSAGTCRRTHDSRTQTGKQATALPAPAPAKLTGHHLSRTAARTARFELTVQCVLNRCKYVLIMIDV